MHGSARPAHRAVRVTQNRPRQMSRCIWSIIIIGHMLKKFDDMVGELGNVFGAEFKYFHSGFS